MGEQSYLIKYEDFSGPANLLLDLVRKRKVDIYQIRLNSIILDFLDFIKANKNILLDTLSSFLYITAILLEIKSSSIIPSQSKKEEEIEIGDDSLLKVREQEYRIYQKTANYVQKLIDEEKFYFMREAPLEKEFLNVLPDFLDKLNIELINYIASTLLKRNYFIIDLSTISLDNASITVIDEMDRIKKELLSKKEVSFIQLTESYIKLIDKIICFLSILELYKNELIDIIQFENFGNIIIKNIN
ncbi:MAG: segregation/condensation protein A [Actinobacteria bacterium]|nr:segregation/condensation protein A [Actinomycetota bacterium]MBU4450651.1 segregation/condensation protein A [Actinomycetota bacterium]MCG2788648.1 segregation/condensation protein A [Actinomycetes bacterium]